MHSQRMASIAPIVIVIGCIDYLAYGTIFTHAMFLPKIKLDVCREVVARAARGGGWGGTDPNLLRSKSDFWRDLGNSWFQCGFSPTYILYDVSITKKYLLTY